MFSTPDRRLGAGIYYLACMARATLEERVGLLVCAKMRPLRLCVGMWIIDLVLACSSLELPERAGSLWSVDLLLDEGIQLTCPPDVLYYGLWF